MSKLRPLERIIVGPPPHWVGDGFHVTNLMPSGLGSAARMSPFVLLDYHAPFVYEPTTNPRRGVGPHPHRGFETVTLALAGSIAHHDSAGNSGVINPGDVQWMTAGAGILHKEYHAESFAREGGVMHMVQLWVNLPRAHKLTQPKYQGITDAQIPRVSLPGNAGFVRVVAGDYEGTKGAASTFSQVDLWDVVLAGDSSVCLRLPTTANSGLLVLQGQVAINGGQTASAGNFALFANGGGGGDIGLGTPAGEARVLILSGEPLNETVVAHGPFVMNSVEEIHAAIRDFSSGKFGRLPE